MCKGVTHGVHVVLVPKEKNPHGDVHKAQQKTLLESKTTFNWAKNKTKLNRARYKTVSPYTYKHWNDNFFPASKPTGVSRFH